MPNKFYRRGVAWEYRVKEYYEKMGYVVYRSAGSHKPADLICFPTMKEGKTLFVQCKVDAKLMSQKERDAFKVYCDSIPGVLGAVVSREKRKVNPIYLLDGT